MLISGTPDLAETPTLKVSGTRVEIAIQAGVGEREQPYAPTNPQNPWTGGGIDACSLKIGGETVLLPAPTIGTDSISRTVRFASTHFPNGNVTIELKATFRLSKFEGGQTVYSNPIELTATANVTAYNKGLVLATQEEYDAPGNPGYSIPNQPIPNGFAPASQRGAAEGTAQLAAMNHDVLNSGPAHQMSETELATLLKQATAFFGFTHGEQTNFRSSTGDPLYFNPYLGPGGEVRSYVRDNRTEPQQLAWFAGAFQGSEHPGMNIVVMHACSVLSSNLLPLSTNTLKNNAPLQAWENRGIAGFTTVVWSLTWASNMPIDKHATAVYQGLASGKTLDQAVALANDQTPAQDPNGNKLFMVVRGDGFSRLKKVWVGDLVTSQPNALDLYDWYVVQ